MRLPALVLLLWALFAGAPALAHESRPAYLELRQTSAQEYDVLWKVPARGSLRLGLYVRLPEGCEVVGEPRTVLAGNAHLERWRIRCAAGLVGETIVIDGLRTTQTDVVVRVEGLDGRTQVARLGPAAPSFVVAASPTWVDVAGTYLRLGVEHILGGVDHLLFVLGLLWLVDRRWALFRTITAFTVAHSLTLAIATLRVVEIPAELVNVLVALSLLFLGPEMLRKLRGEDSLTLSRPWLVAFGFGLLHGLGFASGLTELGLPEGELPLALLSFNVGVELGQVGFVAVLLAAGAALGELGARFGDRARRVPAYVVGSFGAFWTFVGLEVLFLS